jgi:uncharacterized membrane protein
MLASTHQTRYWIIPMTEWYYARGGQQSGPVSFEQLQALVRSGGLDASKDLVWTASMKDWSPASQVPGLLSPITHTPDPSNPYATPQSSWSSPSPSTGENLLEIAPGSEPINVGACMQRGFELTKRQFGTILLVGVVYFAVISSLTVLLSLVIGITQSVLATPGPPHDMYTTSTATGTGLMIVTQLISQVFSLFIGLGLTRIGLNLVSGKPVSVGMLFGEGNKLLRVIGASILFGFIVCAGFLLLIVPGIYLSLRYGQYMLAIVDRDLGVIESFRYASSLTTNNRGNLLLFGLLAMAILLAGMLACGLGLIFAAPVVWLSYLVAYRWMQYGSRVTMDHPGTTTPLHSSVP